MTNPFIAPISRWCYLFGAALIELLAVTHFGKIAALAWMLLDPFDIIS